MEIFCDNDEILLRVLPDSNSHLPSDVHENS